MTFVRLYQTWSSSSAAKAVVVFQASIASSDLFRPVNLLTTFLIICDVSLAFHEHLYFLFVQTLEIMLRSRPWATIMALR